MIKTGTLTEGVFKVQNVKAVGIRKEELLKYTAYAECFFSSFLLRYRSKRLMEKKIDGEESFEKQRNGREKVFVRLVDSKEVFGRQSKVDGRSIILSIKKVKISGQFFM